MPPPCGAVADSARERRVQVDGVGIRRTAGDTKPAGVVVDPMQEQPATGDLFEHRQPARLLGQRRCQCAAGPLGDRRCQHEVGDLRFQCVEDALGQELTDDVICAACRPSRLEASAPPRKNKVASRRPAAHPSVEAASAATSAPDKARPTRMRPARHDELQVVAAVFEQETESGGRLAVRYPMPVIHDEGDSVVVVVYLVNQRCQNVAG